MHRILVVMLCIVVSALAGAAVAQDPATGGVPDPAISARQLDTAEIEAVKAALDGKTPEEINALLPTLLPGSITNSLGSMNSDLVYVPVTPCRIIDTRAAGGRIAAGETRSYHIVGSTDLSAYGGNAAGCGIPGDLVGTPTDGGVIILGSGQKVRAMAINFVAVNPLAAGDLRIWPTNQTAPTASAVNYSVVSGLNIANGVVVPSCDATDFIFPIDPCPNGDISILADVGATHVVADVTGYFIPATGYGKRGSTVSSDNVNLPAACTNILSVSVSNSSDYTRTVVCTGSANVIDIHASGTSDTVLTKISTAATTCPTFGNFCGGGEGCWTMPTGAASGVYYNTLTTVQTFTIAANTSATYYLNGQTYAGSTSNYTGGESLACIIP